MQVLNKNKKKLVKYFEDRIKITWDEYLERFEGTKPLEIWSTYYDDMRDAPEEVECEIDLLIALNNQFKLKKLDKLPKIIGGFKTKVTKEQVDKLDYIYPNFLGLGRIYRKNFIDIMLKICPNDFEPIAVTLISLHKLVEPFEIKDFYAINVLKCIDAIDQDNSDLNFYESGYCLIKKLKYKNDPWQNGIKFDNKLTKTSFKYETPCMIALDALSGEIVWHPKLAKELPVSPMYWFIKDEERCKTK